MNYLKTKTKTFLLLFTLTFLAFSCDDDAESMAILDLDSKTYQLFERSNSGVSGTATFTNRSDGTVLLTLSLNGTPQNGMHPSHIHFNSAAEGGGIAVSLTPVNGATGMSETTITETDNGDPLTYMDFLNFDGYINVHLSANDLATVVAQGDIGQNELTGDSKSYALGEKDVNGIDGTLLLEKRLNGETLATIMLNNTPAGGSHPAHIHANTAAEGGGILFTFNAVDGDSGMSMSNIANLDDNTSITYEELLDIDAYVNVHLSANELSTIVAQGDIGQNEFTGRSKSYDLNEKDVTGISGTVLFEERVNGEVQATIILMGTPNGGMHPAHIHANSASQGGPILYTFGMVDGTTGMIRKNISMLDDNSPITYSDLLSLDAYINVHLSASDLGTLVAQGDIGSNAM